MSQSGPSWKKHSSRKKDDKVEEEILSMIEEGHEQGVILEDEAEMISNIFEFADKLARDVMTSRQRIVAIDQNMLIKDALQFSIENKFSRYPVFEEDIDTIIGVLHLKDLIAAYLEEPEEPVSVIAEEAMIIHPTYDISKLLKKMQKEKIHMAVVIDEYGQTEGIVTLEDIIEEIIGNILDEHDEEEKVVKRKAKDGYVVEGLLPLDEAEELLPDIEFPDTEIETLNGFLLCELGRLPEEGETIEIDYQGYRFTPVEISNKMIKLVKITKLNPEVTEGKEDKE